MSFTSYLATGYIRHRHGNADVLHMMNHPESFLGFIAYLFSKWTAFIQRVSNQRPLKALYNIASHSTTHSHTPSSESTTQASAGSSGAVRVRCLGQGHHDTQTSNLRVTSRPALPPELLFRRGCSWSGTPPRSED